MQLQIPPHLAGTHPAVTQIPSSPRISCLREYTFKFFEPSPCQPAPSNPHPPPPSLPHPSHPLQHPPPYDDRGHEPNRCPPMQEQWKPPHSPAHPAYPAYPPPHHDSMMPGTPNSAHPPPPTHSHSYPDDKCYLSFDNGPPPHMHRQPSCPLLTPLPHQSSSYATPHGDSLNPIQFVYSTSSRRCKVKKKMACDSCRLFKTKCDELKPCKSCTKKNTECKYREADLKPQDKVAADILDSLMFLRSKFCHFDRRINQLETALKRVVPSVEVQPLSPVDHDDHDRTDSVKSPPPIADDACSSSPGETPTVTVPIGIAEARNITWGVTRFS